MRLSMSSAFTDCHSSGSRNSCWSGLDLATPEVYSFGKKRKSCVLATVVFAIVRGHPTESCEEDAIFAMVMSFDGESGAGRLRWYRACARRGHPASDRSRGRERLVAGRLRIGWTDERAGVRRRRALPGRHGASCGRSSEGPTTPPTSAYLGHALRDLRFRPRVGGANVSGSRRFTIAQFHKQQG